MEQLLLSALPEAIGAIIAASIIGIAGYIWRDKRPWIKWAAFSMIVVIILFFFGYQFGYKKGASTQAAVTQIPTSADTPHIVPIEMIPSSVFSYEGEDDENVRAGDAYLYLLLDGNAIPSYHLKYYLPPDADKSYGGFVFRFDEIQNWSEYEAIEFTVEFAENALADFTVRDASKSVDYLRIGDFDLYRDGVSVVTSKNTQTITVPLDILQGINTKTIEEIGFNVGYHFTTDSNEFTVHNINLIKSE